MAHDHPPMADHLMLCPAHALLLHHAHEGGVCVYRVHWLGWQAGVGAQVAAGLALTLPPRCPHGRHPALSAGAVACRKCLYHAALLHEHRRASVCNAVHMLMHELVQARWSMSMLHVLVPCGYTSKQA